RTIWGILSARRAYAFSFSVPILELARRESQYCSYPGYIRRPRISASTEFSVSFITFHVSSSSAIAQSISPFGPSIKQSTDVCRAAIIFLIIIFPVRLVQSHYYQSYGFNYGDSQESFVKDQLKFLRVVEQMISSFENSVWIPIFRDSTCYFTGVGDPEECAKADGIS
ncbi:MAG: hypothetical protein WCE99_07915, partial [Nitrososphaeraceae archaeon]